MKTCVHCHLCFEDHTHFCSSCGAPLSEPFTPAQTPVTAPTPARQPSLVKAIIGLILSASGLECAVAAAMLQSIYSLFPFLFGLVSMLDNTSSDELQVVGTIFSGYSLFLMLILGGFALALALVGRHLSGQSAAAGNRSRMISVSRTLSRVAVIVMIVTLAVSTLALIGSLAGAFS